MFSTVRRAHSRFIRAEDGAILPFTIVMFLMMVVATGMAVDYMRHETFRAELQNGLDRGLLAAADLDQTLDPVETVGGFFKSSEWFGKQVVSVAADQDLSSVPTSIGEVALRVDVEENDILEDGFGARRLTAEARYEFSTFFLRIIGYPTLTVLATGTAEERRKDVELSLVLDISGTMRYCGTGNERTCADNGQRRIVLLQDAAKRFLERVIDPEIDQAGTTSVNIIPYAGQVNPGPTMFAALGGRRDQYINTYGVAAAEINDRTDNSTWDMLRLDPADVGSYIPAAGEIPAPSSCLDLTDSDFNGTGLPGAGSYTQTAHFHNWSIDNEEYWGIDPVNGTSHSGGTRRGLWMNWGWCPTDDFGAITYLENNLDTLSSAISDLEFGLHDGTGTNNAMKWALALLDPDSRSQMADVAGNEDFANERPVAWDDPKTLKVIVLMTDGQITEQRRPSDRYEADNARAEGGTAITVPQSTAISQFNAMCELARQNNVIVFTIAFEAPESVKQTMRDCAFDPETHFKDVAGLDINTAFNEISTTLQKIKLVN